MNSCRAKQLLPRGLGLTGHTQQASSRASSNRVQICWIVRREFSNSSTSIPPRKPKRTTRSRRHYLLLAAVPLAFLPFTLFGYKSSQDLSPQIYSEQTVSSISNPTPRHDLLAIPIPQNSIPLFKNQAVRRDGSTVDNEKGEVIIQHVMIKNPDLQIERPYTPVNDPGEDGEMQLVVKRVKGGEVGRMVHTLKPGGQVGLRGPITTFSLIPSEYDKIVMVSTGTGIAPFLQLLSKLPPQSESQSQSSSTSSSPSPVSSTSPTSSQPGSPQLHLIHSMPSPTSSPTSSPPRSITDDGPLAIPDFTSDPSLLPRLISRHPNLTITRPPPGPIARQVIEEAVSDRKRGAKVLVLVCLPPALMRPLCGGLTLNLAQGPITGVLGDLGLISDEVWKLE